MKTIRYFRIYDIFDGKQIDMGFVTEESTAHTICEEKNLYSEEIVIRAAESSFEFDMMDTPLTHQELEDKLEILSDVDRYRILKALGKI